MSEPSNTLLNLPPEIFRAANRLDQDSPWLVLLKVQIEGESPMYLVNNTEDIVYQGNTHIAFAFTIDRPKESSKGEIPTVQLAVANATKTLQFYVERYNGAIGSMVTIIIVNAKHLDSDYAELTVDMDIMSCKCTAQWVTFTLGAVNPLNRKHPVDQYIALHCRFNYMDDPRCGYVGDMPMCDRTIDACKLRGNISRFGGHPGLDGRGLRLV